MPWRSGSIIAMTPALREASERAPACGWYPSSATASITRCAVSGEIERFPLKTYETVLAATPAREATSAMVTPRPPPITRPRRI
ncbi:hypothetical protein GCM10029992_39930 [Glycomyces albus]